MTPKQAIGKLKATSTDHHEGIRLWLLYNKQTGEFTARLKDQTILLFGSYLEALAKAEELGLNDDYTAFGCTLPTRSDNHLVNRYASMLMKRLIAADMVGDKQVIQLIRQEEENEERIAEILAD